MQSCEKELHILEFIRFQSKRQWENGESGSEAMRMGEKAKEDKDEGRGENGARTVESGFGEKDGGGPLIVIAQTAGSVHTD